LTYGIDIATPQAVDGTTTAFIVVPSSVLLEVLGREAGERR
jgi:hypothetical protein